MIEVDIHNVHNNVFIKTFSNSENERILLEMALPEPIKKVIDFSSITIDPTSYVSDEIRIKNE